MRWWDWMPWSTQLKLVNISWVCPLDCKEIKPVNCKGNQSWIFNGKTDVEAETPILWPPDTNWLIVKDPDAGKDWRQEKGTTEDEMVGWHHRLEGHEFEQAPGDGNGQGSLGYCSPWGHTELDTTEWLNWKLISRRQWQYKYSKGQNLDYKWSQEKGARTKDI